MLCPKKCVIFYFVIKWYVLAKESPFLSVVRILWTNDYWIWEDTNDEDFHYEAFLLRLFRIRAILSM